MPQARHTHLRCVIGEQHWQNQSLCTGININVPSGLTRTEAVAFVTNQIAAEVFRYAAWEALGLGPNRQRHRLVRNCHLAQQEAKGVWTVTHDPEKEIQLEWIVHNDDMECIAVCPSEETAKLIAGLLNGVPTILPR